NDDVRTAAAIVRSVEVAADHRDNAQDAEVRRRDSLTFEPLGLVAARQRRLPRLEDRKRFERSVALRQPAVHAERAADRRAVLCELAACRDPAGIRIRERLEQDRIDRAEYRGRRADAEP